MSRAVKDKWRQKEWFEAQLPRYFGESKLGETPAEDPSKIVGRILETTLSQITGDFSQEYLKLYFQITSVDGHQAKTVFKGHEYLRDYLRSLVRRRSTKIDGIFMVNTIDGYKLKIVVVALSQKRIKTSQEKKIRSIMKNIVESKAKALTFEQMVHEIVLGKLASDIYNEARKITNLRHVGVRKSELLAMPNQ
ncbi:MAG: 30S ribosomal protein S3ae [Candidatus Bathyarchaeia archaeon]